MIKLGALYSKGFRNVSQTDANVKSGYDQVLFRDGSGKLTGVVGGAAVSSGFGVECTGT